MLHVAGPDGAVEEVGAAAVIDCSGTWASPNPAGPHGEAELRHPEPGFYIAGMKSHGRAPTFLLATGHEQVRSIAAALAGDWEAARDVQLDLPETGVCSRPGPTAITAKACCTPTTPQGVCCEAKPELAADAPCCGPAPARASGCCG